MKKSIIIMSALVCVLAFSGWAGAYSGTYLGTEGLKKSNPTTEEEVLRNLLTLPEDIDLVHIDGGQLGGGSNAGTFTFDEPLNNQPVYYGVKASNSIAFFLIKDFYGDTFDWSTINNVNGGGNQPAISHLTVWTSLEPPTFAEIPEPSSMFLVGIGLLGLFGVSRKLKK